jgi:Neurotransmitter-gated ion-channel ligand binding domain
VTRIVVALALLAMAFAEQASAQASLPTGKGLPLLVKVAIAFVDISDFDENTGNFRATVDLRLRWDDLSLRQPQEEFRDPPRVYRGADALAEASRIWTPDSEIANQVGEASRSELGLRTFPDGRVELMRRVTGEFATAYDVGRFPFGAETLQVKLAMRNQTADQVMLEFEQDDLDFSRPAASAALDGWNLRFVDLKVEPLPGWYGASHSTMTASLEIIRKPGPIIAAIFIPLLASLLIPLLAIWLNRVEDGVFQIETFELVNIIIGGLFAVIALNFTVNSVYAVLQSADNPVNRLFALNYVTLAISLAVNILLFRFGVVERAFGRYVQEQFYLFLVWAIPLLVLTTAVSVILVALT